MSMSVCVCTCLCLCMCACVYMCVCLCVCDNSLYKAKFQAKLFLVNKLIRVKHSVSVSQLVVLTKDACS